MERLSFDLRENSVRDVNRALHQPVSSSFDPRVTIKHPDGAHNLAVGMYAQWQVQILGHVGYYAAGMNQDAEVWIDGNAGTGVAENMMSGRVHVRGFASNAAGASAHGGLLVIDGDAGLRCGISLKGGDIVVGGSVGSFSAFMAQAGRMLICGNAGDALGDSLYEAVLYVRGKISSLGADAQEEPMQEEDFQVVDNLLRSAGTDYRHHDAQQFRRIASARRLYHWNANTRQNY